MSIVSGILRFIIGAAFGLASYLVLSPALAAFIDTTSLSSGPAIALMICVVIGALIGLLSSGVRRAFGWGFLELALCTIALPLSTMLLSGRIASEMTSVADAGDKGATLLGAGIGASLMTGAAAIVGFFLGAIFLIVALILLLGGRREVILVDRATGVAVPGTRATPKLLAERSDAARRSKRDRNALQNDRIEPPLR